MQSQIQEAANKIADKFGIAHVAVRRMAGADQDARMEYMRHEMAHAVHMAQVAARGVRNAGDNAHGRNWRQVAMVLGALPKDDHCNMKRAARNDAKAAKVGRFVARPALVQAMQVARPVAEVRVQNPQTRGEWMKYIAQNGLVKLGNGVSRTAYALDDKRVVKIVTTEGDRFAFEQTRNEIACWMQASASKREYLAEIFAHGEGWEVMERAQFVLRNCDAQTQQSVSRDLQMETRINDLHGGNIGYFGKGRFKILDYGL